jgi:2-keto-4-pentenoate hydratase
MKMLLADLDELAERQLADYDAHCPGLIFEAGSAFLTVPQAYALQIQVARLRMNRGEPLAGYKVGCVSLAVRRQLGLRQPVFGYIFSTEVYGTGTVLDPTRFDGLAIEGEFAVRINQDVPGREWLRKHPVRAIASIFVVIELHNYVFRSDPPTAQELIANNALHAGVVLPGKEGPIKSPDEVIDEEFSIFRNGLLLGTSTARHLPGGPIASLLELAGHLESLGMHLKQGQIILTGSPLPLYRVFSGDRIEVRCQRLSTVEVSIK